MFLVFVEFTARQGCNALFLIFLDKILLRFFRNNNNLMSQQAACLPLQVLSFVRP